MGGRTKALCPGCQKEQDAGSFWKNAGSGKRASCRHSTCLECRTLESAEGLSAWDWAAGLCKATSMAAMCGHKENPTIPEWSGKLDAPGVRALFTLQDGKCAITRLPLMIPPSYVRIPRHGTLTDWVSTLQPEAAGRVPVIQRVSPASTWTPGSVVLVAAVIAPYIDWAGGLEKARALLGSLQVPVIPTAAAIAEARAAAIVELKAEFAHERTRMRYARMHDGDAAAALENL